VSHATQIDRDAKLVAVEFRKNAYAKKYRISQNTWCKTVSSESPIDANGRSRARSLKKNSLI